MHSALMKSGFSDEQSPGNRQYQLYNYTYYTHIVSNALCTYEKCV